MRTRRGHGFTLVEVLVAFLVLALAIAAATRSTAGGIEAVGTLRARMAANWLAQDHVAELRAARAWPDLGTREGLAVQAGIRFLWREQIASMPVFGFRRVDVSVSLATDPDAVAARQVVILRHPGSQ